MEQLKTRSKNNDLVRENGEPIVLADRKRVVVEFKENISEKTAIMLSEQMKEFMEVVLLKMEQHGDDLNDVKQSIETKTITPQQLRSLESLVDKKARIHVDKMKGIQLTIDVLLNYDNEELKELQSLINKQYGKTKQRIWIDLNKECLGRKGTDPKDRIPATQVDEAFDFVRTWGGFSI